jgi:phosphate starvation-inducible protein PhoH
MAGFSLKSNNKDLDLRNNKDRDRMYQKFSSEQKEMFHSIKEHTFTFCESCAGSGKTLVTIAAMLDLLANDDISKIIYMQKVSQRYLQNGYLPGNMEEKTEALWQPFYDAMLKLGYTTYDVEDMINNGMIELTTDSALRGINLENVGLCLDEAQNCDYRTLKLIFTRCDDDCHVSLIGDSKQKDNKGDNSIFIEYGKYMAEPSFGNICHLTKNYRGKFSQHAENFDIDKCKK